MTTPNTKNPDEPNTTQKDKKSPTPLEEECISNDQNDDSPSTPPPSHNMTGKYAILQEVNETEMETWLYFIRYEGNEKNLKYLNKQLESVDWYIMDDCSTFDIDLEYLVSAQTAKEMTKVDLNAHQWHRKFDGKLQKIDLNLRAKKDEKKMIKIFDILGYGQIENYISDEDVDEEDLTEDDSDGEFNVSGSDSGSDSGNDSGSDSGNDSGSDSEEASNKEVKNKPKQKGIPPALLKSNLPRFAKAKRRQRKSNWK